MSPRRHKAHKNKNGHLMERRLNNRKSEEIKSRRFHVSHKLTISGQTSKIVSDSADRPLFKSVYFNWQNCNMICKSWTAILIKMKTITDKK